MKVLEAMSLGVPCVLSSKAAEGLILPEIIPVCQSKAEFIEKLSILLLDKELCKKIGKAGQEFIETEFSSELVSNKLIDSLKYKYIVPTLNILMWSFISPVVYTYFVYPLITIGMAKRKEVQKKRKNQ